MPNLRMLLLLTLIASLSAAQAIDKLALVVTAPRQVSPDEVELGFVLSNPYPEREGLLTLTFNPTHFQIRNPNARCTVRSLVSECIIDTNVLGREEFATRLGLKSYFERDSIQVTYSMPTRNASVEARMFLSNTPEPGTLNVTQLTGIGFALAILGAILWALTLVKIGRGAAKRYFLLMAVVSNIVVAGGLMLAFSPALSVVSGLVFSLVFAAGFLLITSMHHSMEEEGPKTLTLEDIAKERSRLHGAMEVAKVRFMRREIDDATFARLTGDIELEMVKLEARERELRAAQQPATPKPTEQKTS